jgi:glutamate/tyrosine decarboxylase-like PLP-dependent enzyme
MRTTLPKRGIHFKELEHELMAARSDDLPWRRGTFYTYWPDPGDNTALVAKEAMALLGHQRVISRKGNPSALRIEREVQDMVLDILAAPDGAVTTLTAGGTESNFLAALAARDWAQAERPSTGRPHMVLSRAAHPSFDKAAHALGLDVTRVPEGPDCRADVAAIGAAITERTVMLVGNAPSFPFGRIDPIEALAALATRHSLWFHVDACVGGFLIPFLRKAGHAGPAFDFAVPGVRSIAADLHKYGLTPTGLSSFSLRASDDQRHHRFVFNDWPPGEYVTASLAGSRNAAMVAAGWAVLKNLGETGYIAKAEAVVKQTRALVAGITAIDGLRLLTEPEAGILVYTSDVLDIVAVADGMTERGFPSRWLQQPLGIHLMISPNGDLDTVRDYLDALVEVVAAVRNGAVKRRSAAAVYA